MLARMSAIGMLVRAVWRRHWRASLFLAVVAGLAAGVVGASFQAAGRAGTSLERFNQRSRVYDLVVQGCPPEVNPKEVQDPALLARLCLNPRTTERFRGVLSRVKGVERTATASTLVVALLDPSVSNHWGRLTLLAGVRTSDGDSSAARPIIVSGRLPDPGAADEVVLSEDAAHVVGLGVGDVVRMAGWHQADLDAAIDGFVAPQTRPFASKIVGVVRALDDVQASRTGSLSQSDIPGDINIYAGPAWMAAHGDQFSGYGTGVLVRVRGGAPALAAFQAALNRAPPEGWFNQASPLNDVDPTSIRRVIDLERRALLVFATIAILAAVVFVGLTAIRQLRRESTESGRLLTLGMTRRDLRIRNVMRALTIAVPASVVALIVIVALSPLGPLGLARKLEFDLSVRFDLAVVAMTIAAVLVLFALTGLITPVDVRTSRRSRVHRRPSRLEPALSGIGPVAVVGANMARRPSSRAAIVVTAIAVAAGVAAGGLVASYDRLVAKPDRYGAWWDVAVGQYSQPGPFNAGIAKLRANPAVVAAAGYLEQTNIAKVDGRNARFLALTEYVGHHGPVMAEGRAPSADNEVALGRDTARTIHKGVDDDVTVVTNDDKKLPLHVVGIVVVNDPIATQSRAGDGVFVRPKVFAKITGPGSVAQSIVIKLDPHRDHAAAIESVRKDFPGSIREAIPQVDVLNLGRLRTVPWLIGALIAILALATLIHALITMLGRNRTTLAVLTALGFTRGQRRGVAIFASTALVVIGILIGFPVGLVISERVWRAITNGIDLPTQTATPWLTLAVASIGTLGIAGLVALAASRRSVRMTASEELHVE
jgi:ABC-type lipoprotein release transport system permease subunit